MNKRQTIALWIAIGLIALMGLVPPWAHSESSWGSSGGFGGGSHHSTGAYAAGYGLIFWPPKPESGELHVDLSRLFIQWLIVAVVGGGLVWTLRTRKAG